MSDLKKKIQDDIKTAMKARDQVLLTNLRGLMAAVKQIEIDTRQDVDDAVVLNVIQKEVKKRRDALKFAEEHNRADLVEQNQSEIEILQRYLGAPLNEQELKDEITALIDSGADSIGKVMGGLNKSFKGRFDGGKASSLIKELLS